MRSIYKHGRIDPEIQDALVSWVRLIGLDPDDIIDDGSFHVEQVDQKQFRVSGNKFIKRNGVPIGLGENIMKSHFERMTYSEPRFLTDNLESKVND